MIDMGAPPHDLTKYEGDQKCCPRRYSADVRGEFLPQATGGDAFETVDQCGPGQAGRVVHEQVHVVVLAIELAQLRAQAGAHVPQDLLAAALDLIGERATSL